MKWLHKWVYLFIKKAAAYEQEQQKQAAEKDYIESKGLRMAIGQAAMVERGRPEGEDRITFELSTAIGGKILNVRRYDSRTDRQETSTYVVPNGEDLSERIVKILQLETFK